MPKVTNGKVSFNLKLTEKTYNKWVKEAGKMGSLNLGEFIRLMVEESIQSNGF